MKIKREVETLQDVTKTLEEYITGISSHNRKQWKQLIADMNLDLDFIAAECQNILVRETHIRFPSSNHIVCRWMFYLHHQIRKEGFYVIGLG